MMRNFILLTLFAVLSLGFNQPLRAEVNMDDPNMAHSDPEHMQVTSNGNGQGAGDPPGVAGPECNCGVAYNGTLTDEGKRLGANGQVTNGGTSGISQ